jgi:CRP/FNR family transcriptional regulator
MEKNVKQEQFCDMQFCMGDLWLFKELGPKEKEQICSFTRKIVKNKGQHLFWEGETADSLFLIKKGRIKLYKITDSGKEIFLDFLGYNSVVGEDALFTHHTYSMNAVALEKSHICACSVKELEQFINKNPAVSMKIIKALGGKLQNATYSIESFAVHDVKGRIARLLLRLGKEYGRNREGNLVLDFKLTHEDIAALTGASRVMVTKVMNELKNTGLLTRENNHTYTLDSVGLEKLSYK